MTMIRNLSRPALLTSVLLLYAACGGSDPVAQGGAGADPAAAPLAALLLTDDPGDATGVIAAKALGEARDVVVEGRVQEVVAGFAMLKLIDRSLEYCGEVNKEDKCSTPWDYCCDPAEERLAKSVLVEFRGADGRPLAADAIPGTRLLDLVKVTGDLTSDEHGNPVLVADGLFRVARPQLPDHVEWPRPR